MRTGSTSQLDVRPERRRQVDAPADRRRRDRRDRVADEHGDRTPARGCRASRPASPRASVRRSSTSRSSVRVWSMSISRWASSRGWIPSSWASISARSTVSGVRSSWLTSARNRRREVSEASSRAAIVVERPAERAHGPRARRPHAGVVVAVADALGALEQLGHRPRQAAVGDERRHEGGGDDGRHDREARPGRCSAGRRGPTGHAEQHPEADPHERDDEGAEQEPPPPPAGPARARGLTAGPPTGSRRRAR